jgi:hypothetical protein
VASDDLSSPGGRVMREAIRGLEEVRRCEKYLMDAEEPSRDLYPWAMLKGQSTSSLPPHRPRKQNMTSTVTCVRIS